MPNTTMYSNETFNELLKRDPDAAAQKLADGFLHLINNHIPGIYLTREEFQTVMPKALEIMSTPASEDDSSEDEDSGPSTPSAGATPGTSGTSDTGL